MKDSHYPTLSKAAVKVMMTLSHNVRIFSMQQIAGVWFGGNQSEALAAVSDLETLEYVDVFDDLVAPPLQIETPIFEWNPKTRNSTPNFASIAYECKSRWTANSPPTRQKLVVATQKAVRVTFGFTSGTRPTANALQHDLLVAELYLQFHLSDKDKKQPEKRVNKWLGEDQATKRYSFYAKKSATPDAVLKWPSVDKPDIVLEVGGQYSAERIAEFHHSYQGCRYEIW